MTDPSGADRSAKESSLPGQLQKIEIYTEPFFSEII